MSKEIERRIKKIVTGILNVSHHDINDLSSPRSIETWKGVNHRRIIDELESEFGFSFDATEIDTLVNYRIIKLTVLHQ